MNLLLNELGAAAGRAGVAMLAQTAVLVLALLAVELIAGRRLRSTLRCALWLLVVAKLLLPPSFTLPTGVAYWLGPWLVSPTKLPAPGPFHVSATVGDAEMDDVFSEQLNDRNAFQPVVNPPRLRWSGLFGLVWLAGAATMLGLVVRRNLEAHRLVRESRPASPEQERILADAAARTGVRRLPRLRITRAEHSPAVCGLLSPVIVLPQALAEKLSPAALGDVLLHELIHIHRRDLWVNLPQTLAVVVWWWNPLVWFANARVRALREQAVDERVMLVREGDPESYPATLVEVARHCASRPALALSFVGILESRRALRARVKRLLSSSVPKHAHLGPAGWTLTILAALLLLPMAFARRAEIAPTTAVDNLPTPVLLEVQATEPRYRLAGEPIAEADLEAKLRELAQESPDDPFAVATDLAHPSPELDLVIEAARAAGFRGLNLVAPKSASAGGPSNIRGYIVLDLPPSNQLAPKRYGMLLATNNTAPTRYTMDPVLARRYGLIPETNAPESLPTTTNFYRMDPLLARRYGLIPETNAPESSPTTTNFYRMDPLLARRYGLIPPPASQGSAANPHPGMSPELMRRYGLLPPPTSEGGGPSQSLSTAETVRLLENRTELETRLTMSRELLNQLQQKSGAELRYTLNANRPTPLLQTLLSDLAIAEQQKAQLSPDFGANHPEVKRITGVIARINKQIDDVVAGILASMQVQIETDQATLKAINTKLDQLKGDPTLKPTARTNARAKSESKQSLSSPDPARLENSGRWGLGHQIIMTKLKGIVVPEFKFQGSTLAQLVEYLDEQAKALDPERKGLNWIISKPADSISPIVDSASGAVNPLSEVTFRPLTPLKDIRLLDALDAMVRLANQPLKYAVEDYAVVFSVRPPPSTQLYTRTYRVNATSFLQGIQAVIGLPLDPTVTDPKVRGGQIQKLVKEYFIACGVEFPSSETSAGTDPLANQRALFFNDRTGILFVRAPLEDLEVVQKAVEALNVAPPQIQLETKFVEIASDGSDLSIASDQFYADRDSNSFAAIFSPSNLDAFLKSLEQRPGTRILAAPKVTTLSGRQAQISITDDVPGGSLATGEQRIGPVLNVTPEARMDSSTIQLRLAAELHQLVRSAEGDQLKTAKLSSALPVADGHTIMLMSAEPMESGKSLAEQSGRVLVFVTPIIIDPAGNRVNPPPGK
ncbi:MAG TPA: M56 family metallopeptidase [Verrucomicrobiota bacterium]|nr:M56 family metallopeptidase [Verrucomicrobiota bacterium]